MPILLTPKQGNEPRINDLTLANPREISKNIENIKKYAKKRDMPALILMWQKHDHVIWSGSAELYHDLGNVFLKLSEPILAYDVLREGIKYFADDVRMLQLTALALARSGAAESANNILTGLREKGHEDQETTGLLARTHKDLAAGEKVFRRRQEHLKMAFLLYDSAYKSTGGYWPGINAATVALLMGLKRIARETASDIYPKCVVESEKYREGRFDGSYDEGAYWILATLGEASLITEKFDQAREWYEKAGECGAGQYGNLNSTRRNASFIMEHLKVSPDIVDGINKCFKIPSVVVFSGHMIDRPGRPVPRFPPELEQAVYNSISQRLFEVNAGFGFSSAACGSDILFIEALLKKGAESHIVLPYDKYQFMRNSVDVIAGASWDARFNAALKKATQVFTASENMFEEEGISYEYSNHLLIGMARMKAVQIGTNTVSMSVWDKKTGDGPGGTSSFVEKLKSLGMNFELIDINEIMKVAAPAIYEKIESAEAPVVSRPAPAAGKLDTRIMALLFADLYRFRQLTETQIPFFISEFLGAIGKLASTSKHAPVLKKTWGDGLYFVFSSVRDAGLFSLELCEMVNKTKWAEKNLPEGINFRMALHAGPVYSYIDPVTEHLNYIGTHVVYAARIEPITPVGHVYSSQAFAAMATAEGISEFKCEYVGQIPLAKGHGTFPIYHLKPDNE